MGFVVPVCDLPHLFIERAYTTLPDGARKTSKQAVMSAGSGESKNIDILVDGWTKPIVFAWRAWRCIIASRRSTSAFCFGPPDPQTMCRPLYVGSPNTG